MSVLVALTVLAGCANAPPSPQMTSQPQGSALGTDGWSAIPMAPDPAFEAAARASCLAELGVDPALPLLVQDRRRSDMTALHFEGPDEAVDQMVRRLEDGTFICEGGGGGTSPHVSGVALTVTSWTEIGDQATEAWLISGHVSPAAVTVRIWRADGIQIQASVGAGRFLAWWKGGQRLALVAAFDATGQEVARIDNAFELGAGFPN